MIKIVKLNELNSQVIANPDILAYLYESLGFYEKGYQFSRAFKAKAWDGKTRLMSPSGKFAVGITDHVIKLSKMAYPDEEIFLQNYEKEEITREEFLKFVESLNIPESSTPRDYQIESAYRSIKNNRLIILSPTSSGKSLIIYMLVRWYLHKEIKKGIILVPSANLVTQLSTDFIEYGYDKDELDRKIHTIKTVTRTEKNAHLPTSALKDSDKPLYISTWQSVAKQPTGWFKKFDMVIVDEAQNVVSASLTKILTAMYTTKYRFGLTATISNKDSQTTEFKIQGLLGKAYKATTTQEMMDSGFSSRAKIKCIVFKYPKNECKSSTRLSYDEESLYIESHRLRLKYLSALSLGLNGNTIMLFKHTEYGKTLFNFLQKHVGDNRNVYYIDKDIKGKDRNKIRKKIESEPNSIIVASYGTFSVGVSINNIENIVLSTGAKGRIRVLQSIGRGLRLGRSDKVTIYDIVDDLRFGHRVNYLMRHFNHRTEHYLSEGHVPLVQEIELL